MTKPLLLLLALAAGSLSAQNVGVGTATPDPSAVLDVSSQQRGALLPRLNTAQRDAIASPAEGLEIYNLDTHCKEFYNGTAWISICATVAPCSPPPASTPGSNSPLCTTETLNLTATPVVGATYVWSGPNSYSSTTQNPSIANVTLANAGTYRLRTWLLGCYSDETTVDVTIYSYPYVQKQSYPGTSRSQSLPWVSGGELYVAAGQTTWCSGFQATSYKYNPTSNTWTAIANAPQNHAAGGSFTNGTDAWLFGGSLNCVGTSGAMMRYNGASNTWTTGLAAMPVPAHGVSGYYNDADDTLYVLGGKTADGTTCGEYTGVLRRFMPATGTWTTLASLTDARGNPTLMRINGRIFGGLGNKWTGCPTNYNDWYEYNIAANTWTAKANYPGTAGPAAGYFVIGSYGYVVDANRYIWRYDPATDSWAQQNCRAPIVPAFAVAIGGKGYLLNTSNGQLWEYTP